jgi:hypothetical protein
MDTMVGMTVINLQPGEESSIPVENLVGNITTAASELGVRDVVSHSIAT